MQSQANAQVRFAQARVAWSQHKEKLLIETKVRRELEGLTEFVFTSDWFSKHIPVWQAQLAPLMAKPDLQALEIGSYEGRSAIWLLEHVLTDVGARLVCVDPFLVAGSEARFDHNVALSGRGLQLEKRRGFSHDVLPTLALGQFDLIYVDGDHVAPFVLLDAVLSWRLLKTNGVLMFDDYLGVWFPLETQRPKFAIDLFLELIAGQFELLHSGAQVFLRKLI
jgi:hypothetical protein